MEPLMIMVKKVDGHISNEDYLTCKKIWNEFNMTDMGDYHDHYLKKDVLLLTDVFEKFIDTCLKFYRLDRCHYFSSPGLSWDAMLKITGMRLKKIVTSRKKWFLWAEEAAQAATKHGDESWTDIYDERNIYQFQFGSTHKMQ